MIDFVPSIESAVLFGCLPPADERSSCQSVHEIEVGIAYLLNGHTELVGKLLGYPLHTR